MENYVCVIGGANIDISSAAYGPLILRDSNPSKISFSQGGVARNIAENLARLGSAVEFITVLGTDAYAGEIERSCGELGISLAHGKKVSCGTSVYLCVNDEKGDMFVAASDMEILSGLDKLFLTEKKRVLDNAAAVVADTNLTPEALEYILNQSKAPVFMETVSANKVKKLRGLAGAFAVAPNIIEAETLTQTKISCDADLSAAAEILHRAGYKWVVITLGERGAFYSDGRVAGIEKQSAVKNIINTTGAGDSFFAALVWGFSKNLDIKTCCVLGNRAAALTLNSPRTVNPMLSADKIYEKFV